MQPDDFLNQYGRKLDTLEYCHAIDSNSNDLSEWDGAELKILVVFLSAGWVRSLSGTFSVLNGLIKNQYGSRVFVDACYYPTRRDTAIYAKAEMEFLFGNASHRNYREYDALFVSFAVVPEFWNYPYLLSANGISCDWDERVGSDGPLIIGGGACSAYADILYGRRGNGGTGCLVDAMYVGEAEPSLSQVIDVLLGGGSKMMQLEALGRCPGVLLPWACEYEYQPDPATGYRITSVKRTHWSPKEVQYQKGTNTADLSVAQKVLDLSGDAVESGAVQISKGCGCSNVCTFCFEGGTGPYADVPLEDVIKQMETLRKAAAPNGLSLFSYNVNYYYRFTDLLIEAAKRFHHVALTTQRADVIAACPEYLEQAKQAGLHKVSIAVEGMGESLRNGFLNKNLSQEQLVAACGQVLRHRLAELKLCIIYTGLETDRDIEESLEEILEVVKIRDSYGSKTAVRVTITPLLNYPHTPLQYFHRSGSLATLTDTGTLGKYLVELRKMGVRVRVHAKSKSTVVTQFLLDGGRMGTRYLWEVGKRQPLFFGMVATKTEKELLPLLEAEGINIHGLLSDKPEDFVFWHNQVTVRPDTYLKEAARLIRKRQGAVPCLRTPVHLSPICHGCGQCTSRKEQDGITKREIGSVGNLGQLRAVYDSQKSNTMLRVSVSVRPEYFFVAAATLTHRVAAEINRQCPGAEEMFYKVGRSSLYWVTHKNQKDWIAGRFIYPIFYRGEFSLKGLSNRLKSCYFQVSTFSLPSEFIHKSLLNLYRVVTGVPVAQFKEKYVMFDNWVKVAEKHSGRELRAGRRPMSRNFNPVAGDIDGKGVYYLVLPVTVNPFLYMASVLKIRPREAWKMMSVTSIFTLEKKNAACTECGQAVYDDISGVAELFLCPVCVCKRLLLREVKRA